MRDWSKFERVGVAPLFRFVLGGADTPITSRFGEGWRLLPSLPLEYESRTGAAVVAGEATSLSLAAMSALALGRVGVYGKGVGLLTVSFYYFVVR